MSHFWIRLGLSASLFFLMLASHAWAAPRSLAEFSLEELMEVEVISATKKPQPLSQTPAAVFVITAEDIRRSGATTVPDLLRMVPGLHVAHIDTNTWAVSARGFNGRFANKLLVMIDGRSIYSPLFSGVFWEMHDLMLEDIERIEVIRGPGGSLWGANAVNGVINILTRHAADTSGTLVSTAVGSRDFAAAAVRQGWQSGPDTHMRLYAKLRRHGTGKASTHDPYDDYHNLRAGLRFDREIDPLTALTLQAEAFGGKAGQTLAEPLMDEPFFRRVRDDAEFGGGFALGRWQRELAQDGELRVQVYFDKSRYEDRAYDHRANTFDVDVQHRFLPLPRHELTWGLGYRHSADRQSATNLASFAPPKRTDHLYSAFVQDRIFLVPETLDITLGTKWEHNDSTGHELQPTLRVLYTPHAAHSLWAAASRAVRPPSRAEQDVRINMGYFPAESAFNPAPLPVNVVVSGRRGVKAETVDAYELGYRVQPRHDLFVDIALFYNRYKRLIGGQVLGFTPSEEPFPHIVQTLVSTHDVTGDSRGAELAGTWQPKETWKLHLAYTYLKLRVNTPDLPARTLSQFEDTEAPRHQISLRSTSMLGDNVELDLWGRYVDALPNVATDPQQQTIRIPSYLTLDARIAWFPQKNLELALVGQNLLERRHAEFGGYDFFDVLSTEVPRSVYGKITWRF